jgi:hypothetical protein
MRKEVLLGTAFVLAFPVCAALAGSVNVTQTTVNADKAKVTADTTNLTRANTALTAAQKQLATDTAARDKDIATQAANTATIGALEKSLSTALGAHDYANAAKIQTQLTTLRTANAKLQADTQRLVGVMKADQTAIGKANEVVILDNRQLKLDTDHYNADQYYLAIGR